MTMEALGCMLIGAAIVIFAALVVLIAVGLVTFAIYLYRERAWGDLVSLIVLEGAILTMTACLIAGTYILK